MLHIYGNSYSSHTAQLFFTDGDSHSSHTAKLFFMYRLCALAKRAEFKTRYAGDIR
jgi:hypothetical protein